MPHPFVDLFAEFGGELGAKCSILVRSFGGAWDKTTHKYANVTFFDTPTDAAVQPSTPKEVEKLEENERTKEAITVYTSTPLQTSDVSSQGKADVVVWMNKSYEVKLTEDWSEQAGYSRSIATRLGA